MEGCGYSWGYPEQCEELAKRGSITPTEQEEAFSRVDRILKSMKWGSIAFNAPSSMNLEDSAQIYLLLSLDKSVEDLRNMVTAAGEREGVRIQVSDRMEARLSGQNFQITAITPEEQAITSSGITEWNWEVTPKSAGQHHLFNIDCSFQCRHRPC